MKDGNIVLLGFMGTGKSAVARVLAQRLGRHMVDMDAVIAGRAGKSITEIFAQRGEPYFRQLERALVQELARQHDLIIATGGGVVLNADNVRDFDRSGLVVCLMARPDVILRRVAGEQHRPLLEGGDREKKMLDLFSARLPLYARIPHRIDTSDLAPEAVADRILMLLDAVAD